MKRLRSGSLRLASAALFAAAFAVAGCKPNPIPIEQLANDVTTIVCQQAVNCGRFPDQQTCTETLTLDYGTLEADVDAGRVQYFPQSAGDCVDDIHHGQGPGSCSQTVVLSASDLSDCSEAVVGLVGPGMPCVASDECGKRLCDFSACNADDTCCTGKCRETVDMMGDCADPSAVCADGLSCIKDPAFGMVCEAQVGSGQPCLGSADCQSGLLCLFDAKAGTGTCGQLPGHGKPCAPTGGPRCDLFTDYCDPETGMCTSRVGRGGDCPKHVECAWFERCDVTTNKCIAKGRVAASCAADDECLDSLSCANGKCAAPASPVCPAP